MFDFLFGKKKPTKRSKLGSPKSSSYNTSNKFNETKPYSAVTIKCPKGPTCSEVLKLSQAVYLSTEAPSLPLANCSRKNECDCRYSHLDDRRSLLRRDTDNGLPLRSAEIERRKRTERRKSHSG